MREAIVYAEFPATIDADKTIEIRARVRGVMEKQYFTDGQLVKKDEQLFLIEPEPYQQAVDAAEADLSRAKAAEELAQKRYDRLAQALKQNAVSQIETETRCCRVVPSSSWSEASRGQAGECQAGSQLHQSDFPDIWTYFQSVCE